jgi:hypothetical protein
MQKQLGVGAGRQHGNASRAVEAAVKASPYELWLTHTLMGVHDCYPDGSSSNVMFLLASLPKACGNHLLNNCFMANICWQPFHKTGRSIIVTGTT